MSRETRTPVNTIDNEVMSKKRAKEIIKKCLGNILASPMLGAVLHEIDDDCDWIFGGRELPKVGESVLITDGFTIINDCLCELEDGSLEWDIWCDYPTNETWWRPAPGIGFVFGVYDDEEQEK